MKSNTLYIFIVVVLLGTVACLPASFAGEGPLFSFGVIADIQYCDCDAGHNRYYRASLDRLAECVQEFNTQDLAFVVQLGDMIERDLISFENVLPIFQRIQAPTYHVLGNHDFLVQPEETDMVPEILGMTRRYYDFSYQSWRFIVLDGNDRSFYTIPEDSPEFEEVERLYQTIEEQNLPQAKPWNGGLGRQQLDWLVQTLDKALQAGEQVIVFCHFPVVPRDLHVLWNDSEVMQILASYPHVTAYMNGHNHAGNYRQQDGIHYLTFQAMVETPGETAYAIVEVSPQSLTIRGYGREPERILPLKQR